MSTGDTTHEPCLVCGETRTCVMVPYREHYDSGKRGKVRRKPICHPCASDLVARYNLLNDGDDMPNSYTVEGWLADGLLAVYDMADEAGL